MSGRRAGGGEPGSRGARAAPSHIAVMQLFHELKQQFPALPDDAVSACIAKHCHDPSICHSQLAQAAAPRSTTYPSCLRSSHDEHQDATPLISHTAPTRATTYPIALRSGHTMDEEDQGRSNTTNHHQRSETTYSSGLRNSNTINEENQGRSQPQQASAPRCNTTNHHQSSETTYSSGLRSGNTMNEESQGCSQPYQASAPRSNTTNNHQSCQAVVPLSGNHHPCDQSQPCVEELCASERTPPRKPPMSPLTSKRPPKPYDARISKLPDENSPTNATGAVRRAPAVRPASLDLPRRTSDSVDNKTNPAQAQGVNLSVNVNCSVDVVDQTSGQGPRRHSAVLEVTPEPTWLHQHPPSPRSYTSVNLTLRTPTTPPQGPIDICSSPSSLTYTTSSWDRRQGLQSRLQITVGPAAGVGSVAAVRTRPRSCYLEPEAQERAPRAESMPELTGRTTNCVVLLSRQKERKQQLKNELIAGKERLHSIQKEIQALRLENTPEYRTRLKKEIRHLQAQCERLTREVDRHSESRVPLGETNEEFYRHIYTGQRPPPQRRRAPPPPNYAPAATESDNEPRWPCHICTFRNHPLMDKCEQCEMPRVLLGEDYALFTRRLHGGHNS